MKERMMYRDLLKYKSDDELVIELLEYMDLLEDAKMCIEELKGEFEVRGIDYNKKLEEEV